MTRRTLFSAKPRAGLSACAILPMVWLFCAIEARGQAERARFEDWSAEGTRGAVVAGGRGSVDAGMTQLRSGGTAADGAAATLLALAVTDARSYCFGGEVPILVYDARTGRVESIVGQGAAPRLATREYFVELGYRAIPGRGPTPATVPAALDAIVTLLDRHGSKSFEEIAAPTLALLDRPERAEAWHADLARTLRTLIDAERAALAGGGSRSAALRAVSDEFHRGGIARRIDAWSRANGGLLRLEDLAAHTTRIEEPVSIVYRGKRVWKCGPWTQGPALLQALGMLEGFDSSGWGPNSVEPLHLEIEALKLAFADRDAHLADPRFVRVPLDRMLSPEYLSARRGLIDSASSRRDARPGDPIAGEALMEARKAETALRFVEGDRGRDTTTCVVADAAGNLVAATPSGWDGVVAGDTGVWLGTRLQSFNLFEGHPNAIEPGKLPRITLTPTIVTDEEGRAIVGISVAGGDGQDQSTLQLLVDRLDRGMSPAEAVRRPRVLTDHHVGSFRQSPPKPNTVRLSSDAPADWEEALAAKGHEIVRARPPMTVAPTMLDRDPKTGRIRVAGDPRAGRHAAAD